MMKAAGIVFTKLDIRFYSYSGSATVSLQTYQEIRTMGRITIKIELQNGEKKKVVEGIVLDLLASISGR